MGIRIAGSGMSGGRQTAQFPQLVPAVVRPTVQRLDTTGTLQPALRQKPAPAAE